MNKSKQIFIKVIIIILGLIAVFLFFTNLGNQYLWQDEAQTALISKTVLTQGTPRGYDGRNYFSQEFGSEYGENYVWKWHAWLQFYITALSFKLFGFNTFAARFPFALFGIAVVFLLYKYSEDLNPEYKLSLISCVLLTTCVAFLILARQCRYYSLIAFFPLTGLIGYRGIINNKGFSNIIFVISASLLFHVNYIYCVILLLSVLIHTLLFHRSIIKKILLSIFIIIILNAPWIIWMAGMKYGENYGAIIFNISVFNKSVLKYAQYIFTFVFPPFLLLFPAGILLIKFVNKKKVPTEYFKLNTYSGLLVIFIIMNVLVLSLFNPAPFFRYITSIIPILCILGGWIIEVVFKKNKPIGLTILIISILYNGNISNYLYELTHDYDGPIEGIVKYLNENGSKNDVVAITYGDMPLKFYTPMRIIGGLTGEDLTPAKSADWIIIRRYVIAKDWIVRKYIGENINRADYNQVVIDYPDIPFENRESPDIHNFRTIRNADKVVIWHRKTNLED